MAFDQAAEDTAIIAELLTGFGLLEAEAIAAHAIDRLGSAAAVLAASPEQLRPLVGSQTAASLATVRQTLLHCTRTDLVGRPILSSSSAVVDYLRIMLAHAKVEQVVVLFMTDMNHLISDEVIFQGSIDTAPCSPREIALRALELGATRLIIAHNHPGGSPDPSRGDKSATHELRQFLQPLRIELIDHLIVSRTGMTSMRELGLFWKV